VAQAVGNARSKGSATGPHDHESSDFWMSCFLEVVNADTYASPGPVVSGWVSRSCCDTTFQGVRAAPVPGCAQARNSPRASRDVVVHHLSLEEGSFARAKVVVDGATRSERPSEYVSCRVAAFRNVRTVLSWIVCGELLDYTDAKQSSSTARKGMSPLKRRTSSRSSVDFAAVPGARDLGIAVGIGEIRVAHPAATTRRPGCMRSPASLFYRWRLAHRASAAPLCGQAREQGVLEVDCFFPGMRNSVAATPHGMLANPESFEGHVVTQTIRNQGTEHPLQRGCQALTYSGLGVDSAALFWDISQNIPLSTQRHYFFSRAANPASVRRRNARNGKPVRSRVDPRIQHQAPNARLACRMPESDPAALREASLDSTNPRDQLEREGLRDGVRELWRRACAYV